jgi:hypothetical protein
MQYVTFGAFAPPKQHYTAEFGSEIRFPGAAAPDCRKSPWLQTLTKPLPICRKKVERGCIKTYVHNYKIAFSDDYLLNGVGVNNN